MHGINAGLSRDSTEFVLYVIGYSECEEHAAGCQRLPNEMVKISRLITSGESINHWVYMRSYRLFSEE